MNREQLSILQKFLREFIPPIDNQRKYSGNELSYIHETLSVLFRKHFGFVFSREELLDVFGDNGYKIYTREGKVTESKNMVPAKVGDFKVKTVGIGGRFEPMFTYISLSASQMRNLRLTVRKLPIHTNIDKAETNLKLEEQILRFKNNL